MASGKAEKALKGVGDLFLGQLATKIITLLFLIAFVRLLNREELAIIPLYYAIADSSTMLFSFGIPATLVREVPRLRVENPEKMGSLLFTGFTVVASGILVSALVATLFAKQIEALFYPSLSENIEFTFFAAAMVIGGWRKLLAFVLKSLQMFGRLAIFNAASDFAVKAFGLTGFLLFGINGLLTGFLLGGLILNGYITWKISDVLFGLKQWYPLPKLLSISWPFYFEGYLHYFRTQGDVFVISAILGTSALSLFYVAKRLYDILFSLFLSIENVVAPSLAQLFGEGIESASRGYKRMTDLVPLFVVPAGILVAGLSYWFVDVVGGAEYAHDAFLPSALFCFAAVFRSLTMIRVSAVYVICPPLDRLKVTLIQFAVFFVLLFILVMQFGISGSPAAQAFSFMAASLYSGYLLYPHLGERRISRMVWIVLASSAIGLVVLIGLQLWFYSVFIVPVYLIAAMLTVILLVSMLTSESDILQLKNALPRQLDKPFAIYVHTRKRIFR